jgi:amino acid adenylation domain-containing protein
MLVVAHAGATLREACESGSLGTSFPPDWRPDDEDRPGAAPAWVSVPTVLPPESWDQLAREPAEERVATLCAAWLAVCAYYAAQGRMRLICLREREPAGRTAVLWESDLEDEPPFADLVAATRLALRAAGDGVASTRPAAGIRVGLAITDGALVEENRPGDLSAAGDLVLQVSSRPDPPVVRWVYRPDRFLAETIGAIGSAYRCFLGHAVGEPSASVAAIPLLDPVARRQVVHDFNAVWSPYPRDQSMVDLFREQVVRHGGRLAVLFRDESLTYAELQERASAVARRLAAAGVAADAPVAVCIPRSLDMIVGLVGILLAGGGYMALDPGWPARRLEQLLLSCPPAAMLTTSADRPRFAAMGVTTLAVDDPSEDSAPAAKSMPAPGPSSLAYVSFTSGSTGAPKGVCVEHRGVVRLVTGEGVAVWRPGDVTLQHSPLPFDASTLEIWGPLLNGGCVAVSPPGLVPLAAFGRWYEQFGVTVAFLTAGLFHALVEEHLQDLRGLRCLMSGGDTISLGHVRRLLAHLPGVRFIHAYGPTEDSVVATAYSPNAISDLDALPSLPLGRPINNSPVYLLDYWGEPVPVGAVGELYCGGDGVARGYWQQPGLTAERFVANPFGPGRLYRSGDMARWRPDGILEFHGRRDRQVKIRGFRVELGEIEAVLGQCEAVRQALVVVRTDPSGQKNLAAFVVGEPSELDAQALRQHLRDKLPPFMVPSSVVILRQFPMTANGKVDHAALERTASGPCP